MRPSRLPDFQTRSSARPVGRAAARPAARCGARSARRWLRGDRRRANTRLVRFARPTKRCFQPLRHLGEILVRARQGDAAGGGAGGGSGGAAVAKQRDVRRADRRHFGGFAQPRRARHHRLIARRYPGRHRFAAQFRRDSGRPPSGSGVKLPNGSPRRSCDAVAGRRNSSAKEGRADRKGGSGICGSAWSKASDRVDLWVRRHRSSCLKELLDRFNILSHASALLDVTK